MIDHALRRSATGKWSAKYGYCVPRPNRVVGHETWDAEKAPTASNNTIHLLKLHGSLNWPPWTSATAEDELKLKQRLYQQRGTPRFKIIPPEFVKNIRDDSNFETLWKNAERALRHAEVIALVGFSFTPTDLHVDSLFRIALAQNSKLRTLVIANPSKHDRGRIRAIFSKALGQNRCVVRQYADVADLAGHVDTGILR